MNPIVKQFKYGRHTITLETGAMGRQADAAVMASMDDTSVFVTVVGKKEKDPAKDDQDFFPLTVDYQERSYAAGRIPGGYFKREGRPSEGETLIARLIDRPIRPLFPEGFTNEVQVIVTVVSANPEIPTDIISLIGTGAALQISGIPFRGPVGAARVGFINGQYVLNPLKSEMPESKLDLVVAGTKPAVLMVESEADILPEDTMLGAVMYGHEQMQTAIDAIVEFAAEVNKQPWDWQPPQVDEGLKKNDKTVLAKIEEYNSKIDERASENTKKLEDYFNEVSADIDKNKGEVEELFKKVSDKEKDLKTSLGIVDEYKEGLHKLKDEITKLTSELDKKKAEVEQLLDRGIKENQNARVEKAKAEAKAEAEAKKSEEVMEFAPEEEQAEEQAEETQAEEEAAVEETPVEETPVEETPEEQPADDKASEEQTEAKPAEETPAEETKSSKKKNKRKKNKKNKPAEETPVEEAPAEEAVAEEAPAAEETSKDAAQAEKEGLDEMLKSEGINIAEGDTVGNIMDMFNAGFSIIEISKVLKISVGEVKAIIDKQQGE